MKREVFIRNKILPKYCRGPENDIGDEGGINMLPKDPNMLLCFINTQLRDRGCSLDEVAACYCVPVDEITEKLEKAGFHYDEELRRFLR